MRIINDPDEGELLHLRLSGNGVLAERLSRPFLRSLETVLGLARLNSIYRRMFRTGLPDDPAVFAERALSALDIAYDGDQERLDTIPRDGSLIVAVNHPFGGIDGLVMASLLSDVRSDVKFLTNRLLNVITPLSNMFLPLDVINRNPDTALNMKSVRAALKWVRDGHCLVIFPSGTVSRLDLKSRRVTDPPWNDTLARIALKTGSPVLPVRIQGRNPASFHMADFLHSDLAMAMLPRMLMRKRKDPVGVHVGTVVPAGRIAEWKTPEEITKQLRSRIELLAGNGQSEKHKITETVMRTAPETRDGKLDPVLPPLRRELLRLDIEGLPSTAKLHQQGPFDLYDAAAREIPCVLKEIGRLREVTFRSVGEGTGQSTDIDRYDYLYRHLFLWHRDDETVAGAYRYSFVEPGPGRAGNLYTTTLFHMKPSFFQRIGPSIELGRSFIQTRYQKHPLPLFLLWRGIGKLVAANPRYRTLFGPVSISNSYKPLSRQLMSKWLLSRALSPDLAPLVRPVRSFRLSTQTKRLRVNDNVSDMRDLEEWIVEVENGERGIPILVKHYLRLGGRIAELSVDHGFSRTLDALISVRLDETDPKLLEKYMGKKECTRFLEGGIQFQIPSTFANRLREEFDGQEATVDRDSGFRKAINSGSPPQSVSS